MPSGSKKRKAAKKKMAEEANNSNLALTHSYGDDDLKHHDEKESDGGEVSSPASQDHNSHVHSFTEGEEEEVEKREDSSSVLKFVTENKLQEGVNYRESTQDEAIDEELNPVEDSNGKIIIIESPKESPDGSSESSNSGSSDDESRVLEKNTIVLETAPPVDSIKSVDSLSEVVVHVNGSASVDSSMTSDVVVESSLTENGEKKLLILDESSRVSPVVMDLGSQKNEDEVVLTSDQYATASSDSQPLVASAPRTVQTTSLKGCCGMFELFTGSNR